MDVTVGARTVIGKLTLVAAVLLVDTFFTLMLFELFASSFAKVQVICELLSLEQLLILPAAKPKTVKLESKFVPVITTFLSSQSEGAQLSELAPSTVTLVTVGVGGGVTAIAEGIEIIKRANWRNARPLSFEFVLVVFVWASFTFLKFFILRSTFSKFLVTP